MILTPIPPHQLPALLDRFAASLDDGFALTAFRRLARREDAERAAGDAALRHHEQALGILGQLGMGHCPGAPRDGFSWDGAAARRDTEAYVLLHEAAHFQLAAPERRRRIDFGLGPGPETGDRAAAMAAASVFGLECEREEAMASLLGILWEAALGQPALASFLDQNWCEAAGRPSAAAHFQGILDALRRDGLIDAQGYPRLRLRHGPE